MQKNLHNSAKTNCKNDNDPKCIEGLTAIIGSHNGDLVSRALISSMTVAYAVKRVKDAITGAVAFLVAKWAFESGAEQPPPLDIHMPASALSQLNGASSASKVVFKTADNDPSAVTITLPATQASTGPLSTITADGDGHHKGDIELDAPTDDDAKAINNFFKKGKCQASPSRRSIELDKRVPNVLDCLLDNTQNILNAMGVNGALHGLAQPAMQVARNVPLEGFADPQYDEAYRQAIVFGAAALPRVLNNIPQERIVPATTFVFLLAVADFTETLMQIRSIYFEAKLFLYDQGYHPTCPTKDSKFFPKCDSFICEGKNGKCTVNPMKPCACDDGKKQKCSPHVKDRVSLSIHILVLNEPG